MASAQDILTWRGMNLVDSTGAKIGSIEEIYEDTDTGEPEWALVHTGLFGTKSTFVPLREASQQGDSITVPYEKSQVKDAPGIEREGELSRDEEQRLYQHYGLNYGTGRSDTGLPEGGAGFTGTDRDRDTAGFTDAGNDRDTVGRDTSGPTTDDAMTRSEEELRVGTERREAGRARLRKYIVTEQVERTIPVQREEIRVEREPITDANVGDALSGPDLSEEEHEVVLHEERAVVQKDVVPKERVRLDKDVITEEQRVSEEVRKEQIEVEGADDVGRGTTGMSGSTGTTGMTGAGTSGDRDLHPTGETGGTDPSSLTGDRTTMDETDRESPGQRDRNRLGDDPSNQAP
jgi:uncharacterized protein (TIGR02271 family)